MLQQTDDTPLILRLREGDKFAFTKIYVRYHRLMFAVAYKYLYEASAAEDAIQNLFLKLWENRTSINPYDNLRGYLFLLLRNQILNQLRSEERSRQREQLYSKELTTEDMSVAEVTLTAQQTSEALDNAAQHLSPQQRTIYNLKVKEELSNEEIAQRLGISINTVKSQYTSIVKILRRYLDSSLLILLSLLLKI